MTEMISADQCDEIQAQVAKAYERKTPLRIEGGMSKSFYGYEVKGTPIKVNGHRGVVSYEPTELVITARAGTPLHEIEQVLDERDQMLAFEPPAFGDDATIGGTIACNFSGPRRAYNGAARDLLLGCSIINGKGEQLSFGGEVMKNVAGYDVSRLMAGAMGTLGILTQVSLKTVPIPEREVTLVLSMTTAQALDKIHQLSRQPLPISASCIYNGQLFIRLSGTDNGVQAAKSVIGGDELEYSALFWRTIKEQHYEFFISEDEEESLWRLSLASSSPELQLEGDTLYEWGGALRWLKTTESAATIRSQVDSVHGHAIQFRSAAERRQAIFHPLPNHLLKLHQNLKNAFDPHGILNPGRMYPEF